LLGCQAGVGIFAQSGNQINVPRGARLEVSNTSVHDYQKNGITGNESGTELTATGNAVTGFGATNLIAQNGIQLAFGARGTIEGNSVINNNYSACTPVACNFVAANILVFSGTSGIKVLRNHLGKSQANVFFGGESAMQPVTNGLIEGNTIFDTDVFDGIYINGNNNTARYNTIFNSDEAAVFIDGNNNKITGNTFNEAPVGVWVSTGTGNQISSNRYFNIAQRVFPASLASSSSFAVQQPAVMSSRTKVSPARP
ncbi:MAG TPA: NosD domain-containing protein, partial [Pyrinomonadaceae bacterium]|nr:NosD domain-containing protein [Pyrinomonadaceae bacterium]